MFIKPTDGSKLVQTVNALEYKNRIKNHRSGKWSQIK